MDYEKTVKYFEGAAIFYRYNSNGKGAASQCRKAARVITELVDKIKQLEKEKAELMERVEKAEASIDRIWGNLVRMFNK